MDRDELADFLKRQRESLKPEDVGLVMTTRRRTPGLRREEVAILAHMSTDFYERLEQSRGAAPSVQTVAALAGALRLTPEERGHLYELAGHIAPPRAFRSDHASPELMRILDLLETPAQIVTDLGVTLRQNEMARALVGDQTGYVGLKRSIIYRWFTGVDERRVYHEDDHAHLSHKHVAALRAVHGHSQHDSEAHELVETLLEQSEEFAHLWSLHEVGTRAETLKRFVHPLVGPITLDCQILTSINPVERLIVFTAKPGSEDASRLKLLSVVGSLAPLSSAYTNPS